MNGLGCRPDQVHVEGGDDANPAADGAFARLDVRAEGELVVWKIALKPGNTWFAVVTLNSPVELNGPVVAVAGRVPDTKTECPVPPTETPDPNALPTVDPRVTPAP